MKEIKINKLDWQWSKNIIWLVPLSIVFILFLLGTFYDQQLASKIYTPQNEFGILFDYFGQIAFMIPLNFFVIGIFSVLRHRYFAKKKFILFTYFIYLLIALLIPSVIMGKIFFNDLIGQGMYWLTLTPLIYLAFLIATCIYLAWNPIWIQNDAKIIRKIILGIVLILIFIVFVQVFKFIFSRPRPRDVFSGLYDYHEWWKINYANNGFGKNKSFPSGHVTSVMCLLTPAIIFKVSSKQWYVIFITTTVFVILESVSRMVLGAHYLSDVTCAILICSFCFFIGTLVKHKIIGVEHV